MDSEIKLRGLLPFCLAADLPHNHVEHRQIPDRVGLINHLDPDSVVDNPQFAYQFFGLREGQKSIDKDEAAYKSNR